MRMDASIQDARESQTEEDIALRNNSDVQQPKESECGRKMSVEVVEDESEDDSQPVVMSKRRRTIGQVADGQSQAMRQRQDDDLEAELADLDTDSGGQHVTGKRLRRHKDLPFADPVEPSSQDSEPNYVAKAEAMTAFDMFDTDTSDENFVEQDSEDDLSAMGEDNPLDTMRLGSMKLRELWSHAIEWMVKKSLDLDLKESERFRRVFERLDNKPSGLVRSRFNSSSWKPGFITALFRPRMSSVQIASETETCDACNQTRHTATFRVEFSGKPYHPDTLDEVGGDNNINGDSNDHVSSRHVSGVAHGHIDTARDNRLLADHCIWYLGSTCMNKAQTSHDLQHWRYRIYSSVTRWLNKHKYNTREEVEKRNERGTADLDKYAVDIVERMNRTGKSEKTWQVYKDIVEDAYASRDSWLGASY